MKDAFEYFQISQKSRYALRALLQMALMDRREPVPVGKLANAQNIPSRFLEVILNELRQGGFVLSIRGKNGGYILAKHPREISVGELFRFLETPMQQKEIGGSSLQNPCSERCLFEQINASISRILDSTSLENLAEQEQKWMSSLAANYVI
jgi:Rrf2 family protein